MVVGVHTAQKGNMTEAAILNAFVAREVGVFVPFGEGHCFDLVIYAEGRGFLRVQCKTGRFAQGCVVFNSRSTDHGKGPRSYAGRADLFGVYFPPTGAIYLVPVAEVPGLATQLRLEPTRNNQRRRVRMASDYLIDRWTLDDLWQRCRPRALDFKEQALQLA
jgi:hypothetical protein